METNPNNPAAPQKSRVAYVLLGLFLGGLGIHNFYAGRKKPARIQLALYIFGLITCIQGAMHNAGYALVGQLMMLVVGIWVLVEVCTVKKDGQDNPFK